MRLPVALAALAAMASMLVPMTAAQNATTTVQPTHGTQAPQVYTVENSAAEDYCPPDFPGCNPFNSTVPMTLLYGDRTTDYILLLGNTPAETCRLLIEQGGALGLRKAAMAFLLAEMPTATVGRLRLKDISIHCPDPSSYENRIAVIVSDQGLWYNGQMYSEAATYFNGTNITLANMREAVRHALYHDLGNATLYYNAHQFVIKRVTWEAAYMPDQGSHHEDDVVTASVILGWGGYAGVAVVVFALYKGVRHVMKRKAKAS